MPYPDDIQIRLTSGSFITLSARKDGAIILKHSLGIVVIESKEVHKVIEWLDEWTTEDINQLFEGIKEK